MSAQVYSVPSKTEGRRKALWEWKGIKLSFTCGGNPIPTCENIEHSGNVENKISKLSLTKNLTHV